MLRFFKKSILSMHSLGDENNFGSYRFCKVKSKHQERISFSTLCIESLAFWQQQGLKGVNCWGSTTMEKSFALRSEGKNSKTKELQLQKKSRAKSCDEGISPIFWWQWKTFSGSNSMIAKIASLWHKKFDLIVGNTDIVNFVNWSF